MPEQEREEARLAQECTDFFVSISTAQSSLTNLAVHGIIDMEKTRKVVKALERIRELPECMRILGLSKRR